jgi:hypothetical protein
MVLTSKPSIKNKITGFFSSLLGTVKNEEVCGSVICYLMDNEIEYEFIENWEH